jgi:hypothetical protein
MRTVALEHYATALRRTRYTVRPISAALARPLIERYHYAGGVGNTGTVILGLYCRADPRQLCLGVTWFQPPALGAAKNVGGAEHRRVLALSRTVLVPWAPRNSATFLLGASIRYIRSLHEADGVTQRWWRLVTFADEYQARHPVHKRIPGGIYRGSNWLCEGRCAERLVWIHRETRAQVSRYSGGVTFTHEEMRARGYVPAGRFALWRFTYDLTIPAHQHTLQAHARRHLLPAIVLQLPLEAA